MKSILILKIRSHRTLISLLTILATVVSFSFKSYSETSPVDPFSPIIPGDVVIPADFPPGDLPIDFFDDYSWKVFIAMVWPAKNGQRGVPDVQKKLSNQGPVVFETYKSDREIFHIDGTGPNPDWNSFNDPLPCKIPKVGFDDLVLVFETKFGNLGNLGQADFGFLVGPLVAQNTTYVRYLTGFNKIEFDQIVKDKLHLLENLKHQEVTFPSGAIDIKSAWIEMKNIQHPERYYTREAWILNPENNTCSKAKVGLVGIHIVQKTTSRPQWIWSSFEHIDNIPQSGAVKPFAFHDGTNTPMPKRNPIAFPPPIVPPEKFNVERKQQIHPNTKVTNKKYQDALKKENSVWQFYQLVMTQWPIDPAQSGQPDNTFPGENPMSAFSNVTMETFDQNNINKGCMACHDAAGSDFLWSLQVNAFEPSNTSLKAKNFRGLQKIQFEKAKTNPNIIKLKKILESDN